MEKINTKNPRTDVLVIPSHKQSYYTIYLTLFPTVLPITIKDKTYKEQKVEIDRFLKTARLNPNTNYHIMSGFTPSDELVPMFALATMNCRFPKTWIFILGREEDRQYWVA